MGLKGFPESAKFRHLFVRGLFQLPRSVTVKAISLSLRRKGGEMGQVTVHKKIIWGAATLFVQAAFRVYPDLWIGGQFVMKVWVLCVRNDHMGVS